MSDSIIYAKSDDSEITFRLKEEFRLSVEIDAELLDAVDKSRIVSLTLSRKTAIEMMLILVSLYGMTPGEVAPVLSKEDYEKLQKIADLQGGGNVNDLASQWIAERLQSF